MDSKKLFKLSKSKQVWVIEDAAHSLELNMKMEVWLEVVSILI